MLSIFFTYFFLFNRDTMKYMFYDVMVIRCAM